MIADISRRYARLPTAAKLLLILSAMLLPIGLALAWIAQSGIREANDALAGRSQDQARLVARSIESLLARNALALRVAANGAFDGSGTSACARAERSLAIAPAIARRFEIETLDGRPLCAVGDFALPADLPIVAPGDIRIRVSTASNSVIVRLGLADGMATAAINLAELQNALAEVTKNEGVVLTDGRRSLRLLTAPPASLDRPRQRLTVPIANGQLTVTITSVAPRLGTEDRLLLLLPVLMWVLAALTTWLLVSRVLIRPLKRLERAVADFRPGEAPLALPRKVGPAREIAELRDAFARAGARVEKSEQEMAEALDGQRKLVREVHHRVKNNLQVVASLLSIHGRSAVTDEAKAAYGSIGRRVGALAVVHRNHFAEMEENRGIALRPLLSELAAELRASAPDSARGQRIDLDLEALWTTQDVAVAVAFLVTEIVEFAMLNAGSAAVEVDVSRVSELTARLEIASPVLVPDTPGSDEKQQFERIVSGLAKQLRSTLDRKLGRYSVDLPVFPAR